MRVTVEVAGHLERLVGQPRLDLDAPEGASLVELIYQLNQAYGSGGAWKAFNARHEGNLMVTIYHNGVDIGDPAEVDVMLGDGDQVRFVPRA